MNSPTHEEKRQIFQRHDLFGMLSANEIDSLISFSRIERYTAGREIFAITWFLRTIAPAGSVDRPDSA